MTKVKRIYNVTGMNHLRNIQFDANYMDYEYAKVILKELSKCEDCLYCDMIDATTGEVLIGWEANYGWNVYSE